MVIRAEDDEKFRKIHPVAFAAGRWLLCDFLHFLFNYIFIAGDTVQYCCYVHTAEL